MPCGATPGKNAFPYFMSTPFSLHDKNLYKKSMAFLAPPHYTNAMLTSNTCFSQCENAWSPDVIALPVELRRAATNRRRSVLEPHAGSPVFVTGWQCQYVVPCNRYQYSGEPRSTVSSPGSEVLAIISKKSDRNQVRFQKEAHRKIQIRFAVRRRTLIGRFV